MEDGKLEVLVFLARLEFWEFLFRGIKGEVGDWLSVEAWFIQDQITVPRAPLSTLVRKFRIIGIYLSI